MSSTIIIRLQNMPISADPSDVRRFFAGLSIPDGGVHVVGGQYGDAFILFTTDEDARQAMRLDGRELHNVPVKLLLSSKAEMEQVITEVQREVEGASSTSWIASGSQGVSGFASGMRFGGAIAQQSDSSRHTYKREAAFDAGDSAKRARLSNTSSRNQSQRDSHGDSQCLMVRNLPQSASYSKLRKFFNGLYVIGIKMLNDKQGNRSGKAYVKFNNTDFAQYGLAKDGSKMEGNSILIKRCSNKEFDKVEDGAVDESPVDPIPSGSSGSGSRSKSQWIQIKGLPKTLTKLDVARYLHHIELRDEMESIFISHDRHGNVHEPVLVELASESDRLMAVSRGKSEQLCNKTVYIRGIDRSDAEHFLGNKLVKTPSMNIDDAQLILLRGIPFTATRSDIKQFMGGIDIVDIELLMDPDNRPSGDARVYLKANKDVQKAIALNGKFMGNRWVEVVLEKKRKKPKREKIASKSENRREPLMGLKPKEQPRKTDRYASKEEELLRRREEQELVRRQELKRREELDSRLRQESDYRRREELELRHREEMELRRREEVELRRREEIELRRREEEVERRRKHEEEELRRRERDLRRKEEELEQRRIMEEQELVRMQEAHMRELEQMKREEQRLQNQMRVQEEVALLKVQERKRQLSQLEKFEEQRLMYFKKQERDMQRKEENLARNSRSRLREPRRMDSDTRKFKSTSKPGDSKGKDELVKGREVSREVSGSGKSKESTKPVGATVQIQNIHKFCTKAQVLSLFRYHRPDNRSLKLFPSRDGDDTQEATLNFPRAEDASKAVDDLHIRAIGPLPVYLSLI